MLTYIGFCLKSVLHQLREDLHLQHLLTGHEVEGSVDLDPRHRLLDVENMVLEEVQSLLLKEVGLYEARILDVGQGLDPSVDTGGVHLKSGLVPT